MSFYTIGIDFGGTNLRVAAYDHNQRQLAARALPSRVASGPAAVLDAMAAAVREVQAAAAGLSFRGLAIGSPGPLELPNGRLLNPPNLPGWDGVQLKQELEQRLQMPVIVESDANAAALAECEMGAGREFGVASLCMLTLGTGVGGAIVLQHQIFHGMTGMAGELGHGPLIPDGASCGCGAAGCLEQYASATAIKRRARELAELAPELEGLTRRQHFGAAEVAQLAQQGSTAAQEIFAEAGEALARGLAQAINLLNLPLYVIGGGVAAAWPLFAPRMFDALQEFSYVYRLTRPGNRDTFEVNRTNVLPARLGSDAGLLGAALVPLHQ